MLSNLSEKLKNWWSNLESMALKGLGELWDSCRIPLVLFGTIIVILKFRNILINFLIKNAKQVYNNAQKQNQSEILKEDRDNKQADQLVQETKDLQQQETQPVADDWYKDK